VRTSRGVEKVRRLRRVTIEEAALPPWVYSGRVRRGVGGRGFPTAQPRTTNPLPPHHGCISDARIECGISAVFQLKECDISALLKVFSGHIPINAIERPDGHVGSLIQL
jgi:hypothetical protein